MEEAKIDWVVSIALSGALRLALTIGPPLALAPALGLPLDLGLPPGLVLALIPSLEESYLQP